MSLVYNLFFPFLVSLSLILLTLACSFSLIIPWLGSQLHALNESYTQFVLNFAFNLPKAFDASWKVAGISNGMLVIYMVIIFFLGVLLRNREELPGA
jgi:competence protein ComEC